MYEGWEDDARKAYDEWHVSGEDRWPVTVLGDGPFRMPEIGSVEARYVDAAAGTGSRFTVLVTPLSRYARIMASAPLMVSVQHPWPGVYPLQADGTLHSTYVMEKFVMAHNQKPHMGDVTALTMTIAYALDREAVIDGLA